MWVMPEVKFATPATYTLATDVWACLGIGIGLVGFTSKFCCTVGVFCGGETWFGLTTVDVGIPFDGFDAIIYKCW